MAIIHLLVDSYSLGMQKVLSSEGPSWHKIYIQILITNICKGYVTVLLGWPNAQMESIVSILAYM